MVSAVAMMTRFSGGTEELFYTAEPEAISTQQPAFSPVAFSSPRRRGGIGDPGRLVIEPFGMRDLVIGDL